MKPPFLSWAYFTALPPLSLALLISIVIHAAILAIKFTPPLSTIKDNLSMLEVVLVNAKTLTKPTKADALAQANLDRGGNTDEKRQAKSALVPPEDEELDTAIEPVTGKKKSDESSDLEDLAAREQEKVAELEKETHMMIAALVSSHKLDMTSAQTTAVAEAETGNKVKSTHSKKADDELREINLKIAKLEAQIAKDHSAYQLRPKRKFLGARTQEYRFARYVEAWRQKIERVGNINYPEAAKEQKLYGSLQMTVEIKSDGTVEKITVTRSSGHKILDNAAKRIVRMSSPYPVFPDDIRKDTDILSITRTWTFTRQDSLDTQGSE